MKTIKTIQILNKNNGASYAVDEAPTLIDNKNETLDSGTVVISNLLNKIDIEPYDLVLLTDINDNTKYMCIDTPIEMMTSVKPKIYRYEISLFSETKQLENTILPNLKISKVWGETRSIAYYIKQYMDEYCPKIRVRSGGSYFFREQFIYKSDDQLLEKLSLKFSDECPEMQWNTPTLREVLNDLMMVKDCIPILKNGTLDFLDLTEIGDDVSNDEHINYVTKSKSSEDYVSELQVKLENVTNNLTNNVVNRVEYYPLTITDNDATMNTNNFLVKTKYPIYRLKSFKVMVPIGTNTEYGQGDGSYSYWYEQDLLNISQGGYNFSLIYEYQEWITKQLDYLNVFNATPPANLYQWANYQSWTLYYTRGGKEITNFNAQMKYAVTTYSLWEQLLGRIVSQVQGMPPGAGPGQVPLPWYGVKAYYYNMVFKIEYETLEGCVFRASKSNTPEHERVVIDNQTNSYVDSYNQGFLEYQKANRLGNQQLQINARYNIDDTLMKIGDVFEDCIIYRCQYQYFKNHIEVNALATKNYILRDYFTGVKSKIRSWRISSGSEALTRHDLIKYYCEFSWKEHFEEIGMGSLASSVINTYFMSPVLNYNKQPLKSAFIRTTSGLEGFPTYPSYYVLDLLSRIIGNSIVFTIGFDDNYWAGKSFDTSLVTFASIDFREARNTPTIANSALQGGGVPMKQHRYTDENGEFDNITISFGYDLDICGNNYNDIVAGESAINNQYRSRLFLYNIYQRPCINEANFENYVNFSTSLTIHKDSQEITNISTQIEFCSETNDICVCKEWLKRQKSMNTKDNDIILGLYGYNTILNFRRPDEFPFNVDRAVDDTGVDIITAQTQRGTYYMEIVSPYVFDTEKDAIHHIKDRKNFAWFLCAKSDDGGSTQYINGEEPILLAFTNIPDANIFATSNGSKYRFHIEIYLNNLKSRNKNIYNTDNRYLIVGHI